MTAGQRAAAPLGSSRALITGAGGLVGRALVSAFTAAGASVLATDLPERTAEIPATGDVAVLGGDLTDEAFGARLLAAADRNADLDVLVNCAAVTQLRGPLLDTSVTMFDLVWAVNVRAGYLLSTGAARRWSTAGRRGSIISLSSPGAVRAHHDQGLYDASKGAVEALTRAMAVEWGRYGIRVNAVSPARVTAEATPADDAPLRRSTRADSVAAAAVFLASAAAEAITGHVLAVDGGLLAQLRTPGR